MFDEMVLRLRLNQIEDSISTLPLTAAIWFGQVLQEVDGTTFEKDQRLQEVAEKFKKLEKLLTSEPLIVTIPFRTITDKLFYE